MERRWTASGGRALLVSVALAPACAGDPSVPAASMVATPSVPCLLDRSPLVLTDRTEVYIEGEDVITVGDSHLVAGAPSLQWKPVPGRSADRLSTDAFAAAYLGMGARAIEKPISGSLGSVRVAALDGDRWAALLLQVDPDSLPMVDAFRGLWYGEYDGRSWTRLERVDFPGDRITSRLSTGLVLAGERLVWLAWTRQGFRPEVRVYERIGGVWANAVLSDTEGVEQLGLAYREGSGLWMLLSGYDAALPGFQKSLRLYRLRPSRSALSSDGWEFVHRVTVADPQVNLRRASLGLGPDGVMVTWVEVGQGASRLFARVGITTEGEGTLLALADDVSYVRSTVMPDGTAVWVIHRIDHEETSPELRALALRDGQVASFASFPSPLTGVFTVQPVARDELLVVGPERGSDTIGVPVRSLILRLSTSC